MPVDAGFSCRVSFDRFSFVMRRIVVGGCRRRLGFWSFKRSGTASGRVADSGVGVASSGAAGSIGAGKSFMIDWPARRLVASVSRKRLNRCLPLWSAAFLSLSGIGWRVVEKRLHHQPDHFLEHLLVKRPAAGRSAGSARRLAPPPVRTPASRCCDGRSAAIPAPHRRSLPTASSSISLARALAACSTSRAIQM